MRLQEGFSLVVDIRCLIMSQSKAGVQKAKTELSGHLQTKELGSLHTFLGLRFIRKGNDGWLSQSH